MNSTMDLKEFRAFVKRNKEESEVIIANYEKHSRAFDEKMRKIFSML